jgi:hypothetical protein
MLHGKVEIEKQDYRKKELKKAEAFLTLPSLFDK